MIRNVKYNCLKDLKSLNDPVIIYALTEESEAIAKACEDNGIKVTAFCDNEIRKTKDLFCGYKVIYTADLPKHFKKAKFIIAHHTLEHCAEQLSDLGFNESYSPLELLKNFKVQNHTYRTSQSYMKNKVDTTIKLSELYFDDSKTYLKSIDVVITTKCSMNCESCANLMQYYTAQKNTDDQILKSVKILSENVDHISEYRIIGGEPILSHTVNLKTVESEIANSLSKIQDQNKDVEIGSYPFFHVGKLGVSIVIRSENQSEIDHCNSQILEFVKEKKIEIVDR